MAGSGYFSNINYDLLHWVPLTASRVLELGCGEGALAEEYKRRNPQVHYTAVEIDASSADKARDRVDLLVEGNFETIPDKEIGEPAGFDAIFMGDVLEHLADPWRALYRLNNLLAEDGSLICCVPNIAHWSAIIELMQGRWEYRHSGLFDRTHLRFFTLDSLTRMLGQLGFHIAKVHPRNVPLDVDAAENIIPILANVASSLNIDRTAFVQRANALQYVFVCRKKTLSTGMMHLHIAAMAPRFLEVRASLPARYLRSSPNMVVTLADRVVTLPNIDRKAGKVIVLQRLHMREGAWSDWLAWVNNARRKGWVIVQEIDDHPDLIAQVHQEDTGVRQTRSWQLLSCAHAVQTSTNRLAEAIRPFNPETICFQNAVFRIAPLKPKAAGPIRVFYGALNRERFSVKIALALKAFIEQHHEVEFVVVHDAAFFQAIDTENKVFHPAMPYEAYLETMASCHIALMPLEGSPGETYKSDIKFLEASSCGVASLASPTVYADTIIHNQTGVIVENVDAWPRALASIVENNTRREKLAMNAWNYIREQRLFAQQISRREDWYFSLSQRSEELDRNLLSRHAELMNVS